jgi:hypothetical protein
MILLNVVMVGTVIAVAGALAIRLLRRLLLDEMPPNEPDGQRE